MKHLIRQIAIGHVLVSVLLLAACNHVTSPNADDHAITVDKRGRLAQEIGDQWLGIAPPPADLPQSADQAIEQFVQAHDERDVRALGELLHDDYVFVRENGGTWSRLTDVSILTKMMNGKTGQDGVALAGMATEAFEPFGGWSTVTSSDPFFGEHEGAVSRAYEVALTYTPQGADLDWRVEGLVIAYAIPAGDTYKLLGMVDMTYGRKTSQALSWTQVKAMFE
jgi:hypothetical protein